MNNRMLLGLAIVVGSMMLMVSIIAIKAGLSPVDKSQLPPSCCEDEDEKPDHKEKREKTKSDRVDNHRPHIKLIEN